MATSSNGGAEKQYHNLLNNGEFKIQQCFDCEKSVFYPRMICPHCGSARLEWSNTRGLGTVYSTTIVRAKPESGGDYNIALIDLDEGVRMMSVVEQVFPGEVYIGQRVRAQVKPQDEQSIVIFVPASGE